MGFGFLMANKTTKNVVAPDIAGMPVSAQLPQGFEEVPTQQPATDISGMPVSAELPPGFEVYKEPELTPEEAWKGRAEAVSRGLFTRPGTVLIQKALGITPEESAFREKKLGGEATAYEFGAMALPAIVTLGGSLAAKAGLTGVATGLAKVATLGEFTQAGLMTKAGQAAVKGTGLTKLSTVKKLGVLPARILAPAVAMGVENALFAAADETAKALENNPNTVAQATYNVGLSGLLGGVFGAGIGTTAALWKTTYGPKYKEFLKDFSGRVKDHARGEIPAADAVAAELQTVVDNADEIVGSLAGAKGLKQQEIQRILPTETTPEMIAASDDVLKKVDEVLSTAKTDPAVMVAPQSKLRGMEEAATILAGELSNPAITPFERWTALNNYKKTLDRIGTFEAGHNEAINLVKEARRKAMTVLEDTAVWGEAGKRQAEINKAIYEWKQKLKYVKNYIGTQVGGKNGYYVVNPDKINTIINQAKKGRGAIKQDVLSDFLDATENLFKTADDVNSRLGFSIDYERPTMTAAKAVSEKLSPGMKAADFIYQEALNTASTGAGGYVGYKLGKMAGVPGGEWLGALFGGQALEPMVKKVLPVLIKPISSPGVTVKSIRAAGQVVGAVAKGENLAKLAADSLWLKDKPAKSNDKSDPKHLERLDKQIQQMQRNPQSLIDMNDDVSEALPDHGTALSATAMNAMSYLIEKRPYPKQKMLFDKKAEPTKAQMMDYYRTLEIAENPLVIVKKIKNGSLKSKDLIDFRSMYPGLYEDLAKKIMISYADHVTNGGKVDYNVKKSLSLFGMQALDTSLTPQAIQSAQAVFAKNNVPQQQQGLPQMAPKSSRKSQVPSMAQTDSQRRMMNR